MIRPAHSTIYWEEDSYPYEVLEEVINECPFLKSFGANDLMGDEDDKIRDTRSLVLQMYVGRGCSTLRRVALPFLLQHAWRHVDVPVTICRVPMQLLISVKIVMGATVRARKMNEGQTSVARN